MLKKLLFWSRPLRYWLDNLTYAKNADHGSLTKLKDIYEGQPMIIVGNGPSLNKTPLDDFENVPSIGMNKIDLLYHRVKWRPDFVICANNLVIKQHGHQFLKTGIPVFLSWKGRWFVPAGSRKKFNFFNSLNTTAFSKDLIHGVGSAGTVTYTALQFAYYMGADPVILFGVDHSFDFKGKPNEIAKRKGADQNHFDPNYFKEGSTWGLPNLCLSESGYQKAKDAFNKDGRMIYDAAVGGKLTVFPKITIDEAKQKCSL